MCCVMYISFSKVAQISEVNQRSIDESLDRGSGGEGAGEREGGMMLKLYTQKYSYVQNFVP